MKVLELGCGTGSMWVNHKDVISKFSNIVFSDFSEGMLAEAKSNIDDLMEYIYSGITFKNACKMSMDEVRNKLLSCMEDGVLRLPKDPGMFVAIK